MLKDTRLSQVTAGRKQTTYLRAQGLWAQSHHFLTGWTPQIGAVTTWHWDQQQENWALGPPQPQAMDL